MTTTHPAVPLTPEDLTTSPARRRRETVVRIVLATAAALSVVISGLIVFSLVEEAWAFVSEIHRSNEWSSLFSDVGWFPRRGEFDVRTLLAGSFMVGGIAMLVAAPIGLAAAIYLSEYASPKVRRILKPTLETLAGIPSVVVGFFAFQFIAPEIIQKIWDGTPQATLLAAGLGVGILTIPLVASVSEDAMRSVPDALREASYGLGARKVTTCVKVVIPAAVSGLVAAMIIAVSRAIGETMVVAIASGGAGGSVLVTDPLEPGTTMTAAMIGQARGTDQVAGQGPTYQSLFFVGFVLFLMTFSLNMIADRIVRRVRQAY